MSMVQADITKTGLRGGGDLGMSTAFGGASFARSSSSGDVNNPQVGEHWAIYISQARPRCPVMVYGSAGPGGPLRQTLEGYTDQFGSWQKNGQFTQDQIGSWSETWKVCDQVVGTWNFVVRPPSDYNNLAPAALLKPMPSIIPAKPGQVSSGQTGLLCQIGSWVNANPFGGLLVAVGIGWVIKGMKR